MQPEVAKAQADTLREWAAQWKRDAEPPEGASEVVFLLDRAARQIERTLGIVAEESAPTPSDVLVGVLRE